MLTALLLATAAFSVRDLNGQLVEIGPKTPTVTWSVDCLACAAEAAQDSLPGAVSVNNDPAARLSEVRHAARLLSLPGPVVNDPTQSLRSVPVSTPTPALAAR